MATTITKTVGTGGTEDYTTLPLALAAAPANRVTADELWDFKLTAASEFSGATDYALVTGTSDATRFIRIGCNTGASWRDHASVATNPGFYDASKGVAIKTTGSYCYTIRIEANYTELSGLQIQSADNTAARAIIIAANNVTVQNCIIYGRDCFRDVGGPTGLAVLNNLLISRSGQIYSGAAASGRCESNVMVRTSNGGTVATTTYATMIVKNNAIFNFTTTWGTGVGGSLTGSGFNCTDLASAPGSSNQVSKTFSAQFENTSTDFRAKASGSDLQGNATPSSFTPTDARGVTRDTVSPWIGWWEYASGGGSFTWAPVTQSRRSGRLMIAVPSGLTPPGA